MKAGTPRLLVVLFLLKKLEKEGLVEGRLADSGRGPARKVFRITAAGRATLHMATLEALSVPARATSPFLLGLANLPAITDDEALAALDQYDNGLRLRLAHLKMEQERQQPVPLFVDDMFSYSYAMIEAELAWIERFSKNWRTSMATTESTKIDLKRDLKHLYSSSNKDFAVVDVPPLAFLMIDGQGDPNSSQEYRDAIEALYSVAYTLKFSAKGHGLVDWVVMPLEGLWWADDMAVFTGGDKSNWQWTAMIAQPGIVTRDMVSEAIAAAARKKELPALNKLRYESFHEGLCAQILHIGPYSAEGPAIDRLHRVWMPENGYSAAGKHHEIYLSDPRRAAPPALKTIIRQPIKKV